MDDSYADAHSNDDHHDGWSPKDETCPIMDSVLVDESGVCLTF